MTKYAICIYPLMYFTQLMREINDNKNNKMITAVQEINTALL